MSSILTNKDAAASMSDLEIWARRGDPYAQDELERQAYQAANARKKLVKLGLTAAEADREAKAVRIHSSTPR